MPDYDMARRKREARAIAKEKQERLERRLKYEKQQRKKDHDQAKRYWAEKWMEKQKGKNQ